MDLRCTQAGPGLNFSGPDRALKNMRSYQRAGSGVEDNGPGRAGPLRPVQVSNAHCTA